MKKNYSTEYLAQLEKLFLENSVCDSHGIKHAMTVRSHAIAAIDAHDYEIEPIHKRAIETAALLHDADDRKFFPNNHNYENLRNILKNESQSFIDLVIDMVKLVPASKNGDSIPQNIQNKLWMLIPRYCDRLEAIGKIGIQRCYQYNQTIGSPLFLPSTPRLEKEEEIIELSRKRFANYKNQSDSMIDHFYDKLIAICDFPIQNKYLTKLALERRQIIIDFVSYYSKNGEINLEVCL